MNHVVIQIGTKFKYVHTGIINTVASIYIFRNSANGCWGTFIRTDHQTECLLDKFIEDFEAGRVASNLRG